MGHNFVSFRNKDIRIYDWDIAILFLFLKKACDEQSVRFSKDFIELKDSLDFGFPIGLDEFLPDRESIENFCKIVAATEESLHQFDDKIPTEEINRINFLKTKFANYNKDRILKAIKELRELINY
jgi:hypothetical protein